MHICNCVSFQLNCGISNSGSREVSWQRFDLVDEQPVPIYNSVEGLQDTTNYDMETPTGNLDYFNLVVRIIFLLSLTEIQNSVQESLYN